MQMLMAFFKILIFIYRRQKTQLLFNTDLVAKFGLFPLAFLDSFFKHVCSRDLQIQKASVCFF